MMGQPFPAFAHVFTPPPLAPCQSMASGGRCRLNSLSTWFCRCWPVAAARTRCCCSWQLATMYLWRHGVVTRMPMPRFRSASWPPISCRVPWTPSVWHVCSVSVCETVALAGLGAAASESGPLGLPGLALVPPRPTGCWKTHDTADNPISIFGRRRCMGVAAIILAGGGAAA